MKNKPEQDRQLPKDLSRFSALVEIIAWLRSTEGCPWDRKQTHATLREHLLEETYEVLAALDNGDEKKLSEELGDLLMQIVLHAQIASENGHFDIGDVISNINNKLIKRHPHVFGDDKDKDTEKIIRNWEVLKRAERNEDESMLEGISPSMPALAYSQRMQTRVARVGFDWKDDAGVIDKLNEEVNELKNASGPEEKEEEFGDILFTLVNLARRSGIDAESALRGADQKFYRRFTYMEEACRKQGKDFAKLTFEEQNALWEEAKKAVGE
jgi:tetrapyrrole methylase family protein / MazG family protein